VTSVTEPALRARGLTRRFGARTVVDRLDLEVARGEIVGLLGPNGAGKTTTFKMVAGLLRPHGGEVSLFGAPVTGWPLWQRARAGLGYIPQEASLFRRLTVRQNIQFGAEAAGVPRSALAGRVDALLEQFGLVGRGDAPGATLSGGERRRAELARALAASPRMLLCDEPFAALDPLSAEAVAQDLRRLAHTGVAVLLTDHDVPQSFHACDRVYIVSDGVVLVSGSPTDVAADQRARTRYLGERFSGPGGVG
jgi:lipopolysaccharide export system ATP-binding protein